MYNVSVNTYDQLNMILANRDNFDRIYIDSSLAYNILDGLCSNADINIPLYISGPAIFRQDKVFILDKLINSGIFEGILVKNMETYGFVSCSYPDMKIVLDSGIYTFNSESISFFADNNPNVSEYTASFELTSKENYSLMAQVKEKIPSLKVNYLIYGKIPMMVSANCIRKTLKQCNSQNGFEIIEDRMHKKLCVQCDCTQCYNIVYNSMVLSLHKYIHELEEYDNLRLNFTDESADETKNVIDYFTSISSLYKEPFYKEFTTGHYKRCVE